MLSIINIGDEDVEELRSSSGESKLEIKASDLTMKIVKTEQSYMIPLTLAPVFKTLLAKYGDVCGHWESTQECKSMTYFLLCKVIHSMSNTKVVDITRNHLLEWFHHLKFLKHVGFSEVEFKYKHLYNLMRAFMGAQASRIRDEIPTKLKRKMAELQLEMAKINEELEICKEYSGASPKSEFMKDCEKMALELKWKDASQGLL